MRSLRLSCERPSSARDQTAEVNDRVVLVEQLTDSGLARIARGDKRAPGWLTRERADAGRYQWRAIVWLVMTRPRRRSAGARVRPTRLLPSRRATRSMLLLRKTRAWMPR